MNYEYKIHVFNVYFRYTEEQCWTDFQSSIIQLNDFAATLDTTIYIRFGCVSSLFVVCDGLIATIVCCLHVPHPILLHWLLS